MVIQRGGILNQKKDRVAVMDTGKVYSIIMRVRD